jgi:hypothetical protein
VDRVAFGLALVLALGGCTAATGPPVSSPGAPSRTTARSTQPTSSPSPPDGRAAVLTTVSTFEDDRAGSDAKVAFDLLAPRWQAVFGSVDRFRTQMTTYIGEGGREYSIAGVTRDRERLAPQVVGDAWPDVETAAAAGRAWIVDVRHPGVRGASAGSEVLLVAPDATGMLRIWILH